MLTNAIFLGESANKKLRIWPDNFRIARDPDGIISCSKTAVGSFLDSFTHGRGHYRS